MVKSMDLTSHTITTCMQVTCSLQGTKCENILALDNVALTVTCPSHYMIRGMKKNEEITYG